MGLKTTAVVSCFLVLVCLLETCQCSTLDMSKYQSLILKQHNEYRKYERASNMYYMRWNASVAEVARKWVERCDFKHQLSGHYGENLAYDTSKQDDSELIKSSMESWHEEKSLWKYGTQSCGYACHYVAIVWGATKTVGCAAKRCSNLMTNGRAVKDALYFACFYYPRGNWIGEYPYTPGAPCSRCEKDSSCTDSLCDVKDMSTIEQSPQAYTLHRYRSHSYHSRSIAFHAAPLTQTAPARKSKQRKATGRKSTFRSALARKSTFRIQNRKSTLRAASNRNLGFRTKPAWNSALRPVSLTKAVAVRKTVPRPKINCRDRLASCRRWSDQCSKNSAVRMSCQKTCNSCSQTPRRKQSRQTSQSKRIKYSSRQSFSRKQSSSRQFTSRKHQHSRRRSNNKKRYSNNNSRQSSNRSRNRSTYRSIERSKTRNPFCRDDPKAKSNCRYWHKVGYCQENQMMRQVYCKQTCGAC